MAKAKATTKTKTSILGQEKNLQHLEFGIKQNLNILLTGETGTGKTSMIRELAQITGNQVVRFTLTGETTVDEFVGKYELENKNTIWKDGVLIRALKEGHWLVVDEINAALPEILFVLHSLLDDDRYVMVSNHDGEIVRPHSNFRFFATMNPMEEYAGTKELNKAFASRFDMVLRVDYPDAQSEINILAQKTGVPPQEAELMVGIAQQLRKLKAEHKLFYTCSTRDLLQWAKLLQAGMELHDAFTCALVHKSGTDAQSVVEVAKEHLKGVAKLMEKYPGEDLSLAGIEKRAQEIDAKKKAFEADKEQAVKQMIEQLARKLTATAA